MRKLIYSFIVSMFFLPTIVVAQTATPQTERPESSIADGLIADGIQELPVLLTPMRVGQPADAALINDMCQLKQRKVKVYRLKNSAVNDVAESLNQWLQGKLKANRATVKGFICNAPVIIVPDPVTNSLIVSVVADFQEKDELDTIIRELDRAPHLIEVHAVIKKTVDGRATELTSPNLTMIENSTASITVDTPEGELTLELTARVVNQNGPDQQPSRTANRFSEPDEEKSK